VSIWLAEVAPPNLKPNPIRHRNANSLNLRCAGEHARLCWSVDWAAVREAEQIIGQAGERWGPYKGRQWSLRCGEWGGTRYQVGGTRSSRWEHGEVKGNAREVGKGKGKRKII